MTALRLYRDRAEVDAAGLYLNPGTGVVYERKGVCVYVAVGRLRTDLEEKLSAALAGLLSACADPGPMGSLYQIDRAIPEARAALAAFQGEG